MKDIINLLIPITLVTLWIISEFRWRLSIRLVLGIVCMLIPIIWVLAVIYTSNVIMNTHRSCLSQLERMIQNGQETQVCEAIKEYNAFYQNTNNKRASVFLLLNTLSKLEQSAFFELNDKNKNSKR
jgi:hypothetical protein